MRRFVFLLALAACKPDPGVVVDPLTTDDDGDGLTENQGDCDDTNPNVSPNATEAPGDGLDADCDNQELCFRDDDGDLYPRNETRPSVNLDCDDPGEMGAGVEFDCDDGRADVHPGATEQPGDNIDSNCDGSELCFTDADNDDYGGGGTMTSTDRDCDDANEGRHDGDCDDGDASISPGATEVVADGIDQTCDDVELCYVDADGDGFGSVDTVNSVDLACVDPGESTLNTDCDDANAAAFPGAIEIVGSGKDEDCDTQELCYTDADQDEYGTSVTVIESADAGFVCDSANKEAKVNGDCDDTSAVARPGAVEIVGNGKDEDCNTTELCYTDNDKDVYGTSVTLVESADAGLVCDTANKEAKVNGDCDDANAGANPGAAEIIGDGIDQDCNTQELCYVDADQDTFGASVTTIESADAGLTCDLANKEAKVSGDCSDTSAAAHPGALEVVGDGLDGNCDGKETCYVDQDHDGARTTVTVESSDPDCSDPGEALTVAAPDCADGDATRFPGAFEVVGDGIDENCDGQEVCYNDADEDGSRANTTLISADVDCLDAKEATALAGDDCNDNNPAVFEGVGCRPVATCSRVPATLLTGFGYTAFDFVSAPDCSAWLAITTGSTDGVYHVGSNGSSTFYQVPTASQDASSVAIDDANGTVYVGCNSPSQLVRVSGFVLVSVATGSGTFANPDWTGIVGEEPMSLAVAPNGDVWVPQLRAANTLSSVTPTGTVSTVGAAFAGHVASVAANAVGDAYVGVGTQILKVSDRSVAHTFTSDVIDFVFDYNDDIYVELAGGEIRYIDHRGTAQVVQATVTGRGKLAITPDGFLQRVRVDYPSNSNFAEWNIAAR